MSITAALLASGCSHTGFDTSDERFPAPRLVEQHRPVRTAVVYKTSADSKPVAAPKAIARKKPDVHADDTGERRDQPRPAPQPARIGPGLVEATRLPPPTVEPRASAAARRTGIDTPAPLEKPPVSTKPPSISALIEQAELNLRIGNIAVARALLEPSANAKHPEALAELGKTYDPIELEKFLVPAGTADRAKAIELYSEAARLGSLVGKIRLARLQAAPVPVEKQR